MFDLKVTGLSEAKALNWWPTHTISVVSVNSLTKSGKNHLVMEMEDVEDSRDERPPNLWHAATILEFTKNLQDTDKLLVHCFAGMRRSTATAIAILIQHGMTIPEAFAKCFEVRSIMMPNRLMLELFDEQLGLGGELDLYGRKWIQNQYTAMIRHDSLR